MATALDFNFNSNFQWVKLLYRAVAVTLLKSNCLLTCPLHTCFTDRQLDKKGKVFGFGCPLNSEHGSAGLFISSLVPQHSSRTFRLFW